VPAHAASFSAGGVLVRRCRFDPFGCGVQVDLLLDRTAACRVGCTARLFIVFPARGTRDADGFRAAGDINGYDYFPIKSVVEFVLKK
jgi:hypothetical protein